MRILFVTIDNPFGIGGGDFATHAYLLALSEISNGNIDVFLRDDIEIDRSLKANYFVVPERNILSRIRSLFTGHLHRNVNAVRKRLAEGVKYDYCVFNSSKTATGLIKQVRKMGIKVITIHHNVEAEYTRDNTPNPIQKALLLHLVKKAERQSYMQSDYNLFLTRQDMDAFIELYGNNDSVKGLIGTFEFNPLPNIVPKVSDPQHLTFAITGSLCVTQSIDAVRYFFEEFYKYLPEGSKVIVSGRQPTQEVKDLCNSHSNVQLIPNPKDMNEVINNADVYVCPTRLGGGMKLRVMDGLRYGIPVIAHTSSARGYDTMIDAGCVFAFTNQEEFSAQLSTIIGKIQNGSINRPLIRQKYEEVFSFQAGLERMKSIIQTTKE